MPCTTECRHMTKATGSCSRVSVTQIITAMQTTPSQNFREIRFPDGCQKCYGIRSTFVLTTWSVQSAFHPHQICVRICTPYIVCSILMHAVVFIGCLQGRIISLEWMSCSIGLSRRTTCPSEVNRLGTLGTLRWHEGVPVVRSVIIP